MPRNGSGNYSPPTNSWFPAVVGVSATAVDWNAQLNDLSAALTQSVSRDGQASMTGNLPMAGNKLTGLGAGVATGDSVRWEQLFDQGVETDVASAATTDIGIINSNFIRITGTTTITSFGTNYKGPRFVRFGGVLTLTHNATTLILPTGANITTAAGDRAIVSPIGDPASGWQVLAYQRADGTALAGVLPGAITSSGLTMATNRILGRVTASTGAIEELTGIQAESILAINQTRVDVASASTVNLTTGAANTDHINITGTTTITAFTVAAGRILFVRFAGALTLTNNASIVTQTNANIITQAGDTCILRATAANTVEVLSYSAASDVNLFTAVASTSGTSIDFNSIPSVARRINVLFNAVSTNGTSLVQVQIGAGSVTTSGYVGGTATNGDTKSSTAGFLVGGNAAAADARYGCLTLQLLGSNIWTCSGSISNGSGSYSVAGAVTLGGTLDRVRITTAGGVDTFDAGSVNVSWE